MLLFSLVNTKHVHAPVGGRSWIITDNGLSQNETFLLVKYN